MSKPLPSRSDRRPRHEIVGQAPFWTFDDASFLMVYLLGASEPSFEIDFLRLGKQPRAFFCSMLTFSLARPLFPKQKNRLSRKTSSVPRSRSPSPCPPTCPCWPAPSRPWKESRCWATRTTRWSRKPTPLSSAKCFETRRRRSGPCSETSSSTPPRAPSSPRGCQRCSTRRWASSRSARTASSTSTRCPKTARRSR